MLINADCRCGAYFEIDSKLRGAAVQCGRCGNRFGVGAGENSLPEYGRQGVFGPALGLLCTLIAFVVAYFVILNLVTPRFGDDTARTSAAATPEVESKSRDSEAVVDRDPTPSPVSESTTVIGQEAPDGQKQLETDTDLFVGMEVLLQQGFERSAATICGFNSDGTVVILFEDGDVETSRVLTADVVVPEAEFDQQIRLRMQKELIDRLLALFRDRSRLKRDAAMALASMPFVQSASKSVGTTLLLGDDSLHYKEVQSALRKWLTAEHTWQLTCKLEDERLDRHVRELFLRRLVENGQPQPVLRYLNGSDGSVLRPYIQSGGIPTEMALTQSLYDLQQGSASREAALESLQRCDVTGDAREQVLHSVIPYASSNTPSGAKARSVISSIGILGKDVALLIEEADSATAEPWLCELFAETPTPKAIDYLLEKFWTGRPAPKKALIKIGPAAEPYAWPLLESDDYDKQFNACRLLEDVGTSKSVSLLKRSAKERPVLQSRVNRVLEAIAKRESERRQ
ncbi:hypothetical protein [Roseiconus lacunae]|uniref:HEAT repeat domain-containing protein n=1 Tax=Roseiconus lacunae TaxID=2605694 RepID=A0ABT7PP10_9BACT|nr:hypothetical protein [Roseiconus lacunae]MDM4018238.1 hypothetical protein [Roseiconus lacunae]